MNYFLFDQQGVAQHFYSSPDVLTDSFVPGLILVPAGEYSDQHLRRVRLDVGTGEISLLPEIPVYANSNEIRNKWLQMEAAPVEVAGYMLDCDPKSTDRMAGCLTAWDSLPLEPGQVEETAGVRRVYWTLADNAKVGFTKAELQSVMDALLLARAVRGSRVYAAFQRLKVRNDVTHEELNNALTWV